MQLQDTYSTDALTPTYRQQKHLDTSAHLRGSVPSKHRSTYFAGSQDMSYGVSPPRLVWYFGDMAPH